MSTRAGMVTSSDGYRLPKSCKFARSLDNDVSHIERGLRSLCSLCRTLRLPIAVENTACRIYVAVHECSELPQRKNVHSLFIAIIHLACKSEGAARFFSELRWPVRYMGSTAQQSGTPLTKRQFRAAKNRLQAAAAHVPWLAELLRVKPAPLFAIVQLVDRQLAFLDVPFSARKLACDALRKQGGKVAGCQPDTIASAVTLIFAVKLGKHAARECLTRITELSGLAASTIKKCAAELRKDPLLQCGDQYQSGQMAADKAELAQLISDQQQETCQRKPRRVAGSRFEVFDMLFVLFAEQPQWSMKKLLERTQQPREHLRKLLHEIASYDSSSGTWQLNSG